MVRYQEFYDRDLLFAEEEWHDGFIFDVVRREFEQRGLIRSRNLTPANVTEDHPFINSELGNYMDHLKGKRKKLGRTPAEQLEVPKGHAYWANVKD
jgi:hypothetical protein